MLNDQSNVSLLQNSTMPLMMASGIIENEQFKSNQSYGKTQLIESMFKSNHAQAEEEPKRRGKVKSVPPPNMPINPK